MEILLVVVADYANITANGKLNIMGIFNEINPPTYPYIHPNMFLVFKMREELDEHDATKKVTIKLLDSDSLEVLAIPQDIKIPEIKEGKRPEESVVVSLHNLKFSKAGIYAFVILINGEKKGEVSIIANPLQKLG